MSKPPIIPPRPGLKKITSLFGKPNETIKTLMEEFKKKQIQAPGKKIKITVPSDFDAIKNQIIVECNSYLDTVSNGYNSTNTYIELLSAKIFNNTFIGQLNEMLTTCKDNIVTQLQKQITKQQTKEDIKCSPRPDGINVIDFKQPTSLDDPILSEYNQVVALCTANFVINLHDEIFDFFGAFVTTNPKNPDCFMYHIRQYRNAYVQIMNIWSLTPLERINKGTQAAILNYIKDSYKDTKTKFFFVNSPVEKSLSLLQKEEIAKKIKLVIEDDSSPWAHIVSLQAFKKGVNMMNLFDLMNVVQKQNGEKQTIRIDYLQAVIAQMKIEKNETNAKALYESWYDCFHINEYKSVDKKQFEEGKTRDTNKFMELWNANNGQREKIIMDYLNLNLDATEKGSKPQSSRGQADKKIVVPLKGNVTSKSNVYERIHLDVVKKKEEPKWPNLEPPK